MSDGAAARPQAWVWLPAPHVEGRGASAHRSYGVRMGPAELAAAAAKCGRLCAITGALQREFGVPLILARLLARKHPVQEYTSFTEEERAESRRRVPRCGRRLTLLLVRD